MELNFISGRVIEAAMKVHSKLGPGLLENVYQACLQHELLKSGFYVSAEVAMPVNYDGVSLDLGYRLDLLVEERLIVELKAHETLTALHKSQLYTYLRISGLPLGLLINFGQRHLKDGIHRIANSKQDHLGKFDRRVG